MLKQLIKFFIGQLIFFIYPVQNLRGQQFIKSKAIVQGNFITMDSFVQAKLLIMARDQFLNKWLASHCCHSIYKFITKEKGQCSNVGKIRSMAAKWRKLKK